MEAFDIHPLAPELLPHLLHFFDHVAFADNPDWVRCYCQYPQADSTAAFEQATAAQNRATCVKRVNERRMSGYLAMADEAVVGWCNASPRALVTCVPLIELQASRIGSIVCFLVAPAWRGRGIAASLLHAACDGFSAQGFALAEAYPVKQGMSLQSENFPGPLSMYERAGFKIVREIGDTVVVQKVLRA